MLDELLWPGTSKGAKGELALRLFSLAKEEGAKINTNIQDADSSSASSVSSVFPNTNITICGGHYGRARVKKLQKIKDWKSFTYTYKKKRENQYPSVNTVKCKCHGKKHSKSCGCMSEGFIHQAGINNYCAMIGAETDPSKYADILKELGKYHSRGIHTWEGGKCSFHHAKVCTCGECDADKEPTCEGKPYESKNALTCPLHALAYEIEMEERAEKADQVIHPILGRTQSN